MCNDCEQKLGLEYFFFEAFELSVELSIEHHSENFQKHRMGTFDSQIVSA